MFAKDFRNSAWNALRGQWGKLAVIALVYMALTGICSSAGGASSLALIIVEGPLLLGFYGICFSVLDGKSFDLGNLFDGFKNFSNALVLHLLNTIFIALWSLLFIIPGIVKSYSYSMSYYIMLENPQMRPNAARVASMQLMDGNKGRLFCLHLSFIGWYLLGLLTFGILYLWIIPYVNTATAVFYRQICFEKYGKVYQNVSGETIEQ